MATEDPEKDATNGLDSRESTQPAAGDEILADELIEDVSIDGMCGVY